MSPRPQLTLALVAISIAACQGNSSAGSAVAAPPRAIELREAGGKVSARVVPGHPCRATVDGIELLVGTQPLIAQIGDVRWTGSEAANGLTLLRDDVAIARVSPIDQPTETGIYTPEGVALFRTTLAGDKADLISGAGAVVGTVHKLPTGGIAIDDRVITGSDDLLLAALLSARQAPPEVRGLAACHRLSPSPKAL